MPLHFRVVIASLVLGLGLSRGSLARPTEPRIYECLSEALQVTADRWGFAEKVELTVSRSEDAWGVSINADHRPETRPTWKVDVSCAVKEGGKPKITLSHRRDARPNAAQTELGRAFAAAFRAWDVQSWVRKGASLRFWVRVSREGEKYSVFFQETDDKGLVGGHFSAILSSDLKVLHLLPGA